MKEIFIKPALLLASSLLWLIVLPVAAIVCSGIAVSDRLETLVMNTLGIHCPESSSHA
jgi:hypothetical protein